MESKLFPSDIDNIINKYIHQLKISDIKKEINKNFKLFFIYTLSLKGNFDYLKLYYNIKNDNNLSLFFKNKLNLELINNFLDTEQD